MMFFYYSVAISILIITLAFFFAFVPLHFNDWAEKCRIYREKIEKQLLSYSQTCSLLRRDLTEFQDYRSTHYRIPYQSAINDWVEITKVKHSLSARLKTCIFPVNIPSGLSIYVYFRFMGQALYALIVGFFRLRSIDREIKRKLKPNIESSTKCLLVIKNIPHQFKEECIMILEQRLPFLESIVSDPGDSTFSFFELKEDLKKYKKAFTTINYFLESFPNSSKIDELAANFEQIEEEFLKIEVQFTAKKEENNAVNTTIQTIAADSLEVIGNISQKGLLNEYSPIIFQASTALSQAVQQRRLGKFEAAKQKALLSHKMIALSEILLEAHEVINYLSINKDVSLLNKKKISIVTNHFQSAFSDACIFMDDANLSDLQKKVNRVNATAHRLKNIHERKAQQLERKAKKSLDQISKEWKEIQKHASLANDPLITESNVLTLEFLNVRNQPTLLVQYNDRIKAHSKKLKSVRKHLNEHVNSINSMLGELASIQKQALNASNDWHCLKTNAYQIKNKAKNAESIASQISKQKSFAEMQRLSTNLNHEFQLAKGLFEQIQHEKSKLDEKRDYASLFIQWLNEDFANLNSTKTETALIRRSIASAQGEGNLLEAHDQLKTTFLLATSFVSQKSISGKYIMLIQKGAIVNGISQGDNASVLQYILDNQ